MSRYVALLGSINVGRNRLRMADLRQALEREDFANVETVVASGNVLFDHDERPSEGLREKLAYILAEQFDIASAVVVLSREELEASLAESPFAASGDDSKVHVHFLECQPSAEAFADLVAVQAERGNERLAAGTRALHIDFVDGVGSSKLTGALVARRLGCGGTARNARSIRRIIEKMT
jgi:uncharacterized protein (DUF1697 family)